MLEYPKTLRVNKSLLFLILSINHILDRKIMKGKNLTIILGIKKLVSNKGVKILTFIFLKNSISSKRLSIIPKQKNTRINIQNVLRKFLRR